MKKSIGDNIFPSGMRFDEGMGLLKRAGFSSFCLARNG